MKVIYVIQAGVDGPVKVGLTTQSGLRTRISRMQTGNPHTLFLRRLYVGDVLIESRIHMELGPWHLRGEWFRAEALDELPGDLEPVAFNDAHERQLEDIDFFRSLR